MEWQELLQYRKTHTFIAIFLGLIGVIILISTIIISNRSGKIAVTINYEPSDTQVFLGNNAKNINHKTIYLPEGDYTFSAFLDGYLYEEQSVSITQYSSSFSNILIPINATAEQVDQIGEDTSMSSLENELSVLIQLRETYPLLNYLPYSTPYGKYNINYEFNQNYSNLKILVNIEDPNNYIALNSACSALQSFATSDDYLSNYNIIFNGYTNIFNNKFKNNKTSDPLKYLQTGFSTVSNFTIEPGIQQGNYYYTIIKQLIAIPGSDEPDFVPYRAILRKDGSSWQLVSTPNFILTTYNTPGIPIDILNQANNYKLE